VIATNETHSVRELVQLAFSHVGLDWEQFVKIDERFIRPAEVDLLIGTPEKAKRALGWTPTVDFGGLVRMMVDADVERLSRAARGVTV
jgi:GDPmannose 4,6-dehydratase